MAVPGWREAIHRGLPRAGTIINQLEGLGKFTRPSESQVFFYTVESFFEDYTNDAQIVFSIWQGPGQVINGKDKRIVTVISPSGRNALLKRIRATIPESSRL